MKTSSLKTWIDPTLGRSCHSTCKFLPLSLVFVLYVTCGGRISAGAGFLSDHFSFPVIFTALMLHTLFYFFDVIYSQHFTRPLNKAHIVRNLYGLV
jgi:hypothetical protein